MFEEITNPYAKSIKETIELCGEKIQFLSQNPDFPELVVLGQKILPNEKRKGLAFVLQEAGLELKPACYLAAEEINLVKTLEGIDPQKTICIDTFSSKLLFEAYDAKVSKREFAEGICAVFGRPTLLFSDLEKSYAANRIGCLKKLSVLK